MVGMGIFHFHVGFTGRTVVNGRIGGIVGLVHALCDHLQDWRRRGQDAPKIVCCITVTLNL